MKLNRFIGKPYIVIIVYHHEGGFTFVPMFTNIAEVFKRKVEKLTNRFIENIECSHAFSITKGGLQRFIRMYGLPVFNKIEWFDKLCKENGVDEKHMKMIKDYKFEGKK